MDLKEQLVIWKKTKYLLDNLLLNQYFCDILLDEEIVAPSTMIDIKRKGYHIERVLILLTNLGYYGEDVFNKFIKALRESDQNKVANELCKARKHIQFGEMLPPQFTYFMDLSEFLKLYPHMAIKFGEEGKYMIQSFIEGKIEMEVRKHREAIKILESKNSKLKAGIRRLKAERSDLQSTLKETQIKLENSVSKIESLNARNAEMEELVRNKEIEMKVLKHFRFEMEDLEKYLDKEYSEALELFKKSKKATEEAEVEDLPTDHQLMFLQSQIKLLTNKFYHSLVSKDIIEHEELELQKLQNRAPNLKLDEMSRSSAKNGKKNTRELTFMKEDSEIDTVLVHIRKEKLKLHKDLRDLTSLLDEKKVQLHKREKDLKLVNKGDNDTNLHATLREKLQEVTEQLKKSYLEKLRDSKQRHEAEQNLLIQRMRDMNDRHYHEVEKYKNRVRNKIMEINKKETLFRKLKNQITVLERYEAKNMNATVPVEECRKIVRSMIGDARILKAIAEDREILQPTFEPVNEAERNQLEKKKEQEEKRKKKKKKKFDGLADDRLMFLAAHIKEEWREFGKTLGVSYNRLDLMEIDHPAEDNEKLAFYMLKAWRDEEFGGSKVSKLMEALQKYGREDITYIVIPKKTLKKVA